jgi:hypothetical protein
LRRASPFSHPQLTIVFDRKALGAVYFVRSGVSAQAWDFTGMRSSVSRKRNNPFINAEKAFVSFGARASQHMFIKERFPNDMYPKVGAVCLDFLSLRFGFP